MHGRVSIRPSLIESVQFVPDSGATNHMVNCIDYLTDSIHPMTGNQCVQGIDGALMQVVTHGSMIIQDTCGNELTLSNVLFVPTLTVNVVSIGKLTGAGLNIVFSGTRFKVENCEGATLYDAKICGIFCTTSVIGSR